MIPIGRSAEGAGYDLEIETRAEGNSSRDIRDEAIRQLPISKLSRQGQSDASRILRNVSLYRRLPTFEIDSDRRTYEFFVQHPDVAVSMWRAMNISRVQMWQVGPLEYETDTRDGTIGTVQVLYRSEQQCLILCKGQFQSPMLPKPIEAWAMMHLQPHHKGQGKVVHTVDLFVWFPSTAVETIAKIISPVSYRFADRNFEEVSLFVEMMSAAMMYHPDWVSHLAGRLDGVLPERPQQLMEVTTAVFKDAHRDRHEGMPVATPTSPLSSTILPPAP